MFAYSIDLCPTLLATQRAIIANAIFAGQWHVRQDPSMNIIDYRVYIAYQCVQTFGVQGRGVLRT